MTKKPTTSKRRVMFLAKQEATEEMDTDAPTLDVNASSLFEELCTAAKEGDQEKVESLIKNFGAPINVVDDWQCSPLYWACLCGHYPVVKFLLENGAQCDRNTFQGERCLYGALNSDIKNLLLSYKITKAIDENQPYLLFLANTFEDHPHSDLTFTIQVPHNDGSEYYAHQFQAHRFVLAARSHYFHENLVDRWRDHHEIKLQRSLVLPGSFLAILRYIYTGHLGGLDPDVLENMAFASKHLELTDLQTRCEEELETILHGTERDAHKSHSKKEIDKVRSDFEQFYKQLSGTFIYADKGDQGKAWKMRCPFPQDAAPSDPTSVFADIVIQMQDVLFPVHKVCLCRSEFFNMMLSNLFHESELDNTAIEYADTTLLLQVVELHSIQPETFRYVVEFLYTDRCTIPAQEAFDVMLAADMLLLDKLKSIAAIALTSQLEPVVDIYQLFRTAVQLNVDRVEQYCIKYMAEHLDDFIEEEAFLDIVRESAETIKMRQETDTIPLIDDLRYFLSKIYCIADEDMNEAGKVDEEYQETWTEMEAQYNKKLELLETILDTLGLEA